MATKKKAVTHKKASQRLVVVSETERLWEGIDSLRESVGVGMRQLRKEIESLKSPELGDPDAARYPATARELESQHEASAANQAQGLLQSTPPNQKGPIEQMLEELASRVDVVHNYAASIAAKLLGPQKDGECGIPEAPSEGPLKDL